MLRWSVNGEERTGNPADYRPKNQDQIMIAFLPRARTLPDGREPHARAGQRRPVGTDRRADADERPGVDPGDGCRVTTAPPESTPPPSS